MLEPPPNACQPGYHQDSLFKIRTDIFLGFIVLHNDLKLFTGNIAIIIIRYLVDLGPFDPFEESYTTAIPIEAQIIFNCLISFS